MKQELGAPTESLTGEVPCLVEVASKDVESLKSLWLHVKQHPGSSDEWCSAAVNGWAYKLGTDRDGFQHILSSVIPHSEDEDSR